MAARGCNLLFCSASLNNADVVSRETHEEEVDKLKTEIQQFKDLIQTQQQLLHVRKRLKVQESSQGLGVKPHLSRVAAFVC